MLYVGRFRSRIIQAAIRNGKLRNLSTTPNFCAVAQPNVDQWMADNNIKVGKGSNNFNPVFGFGDLEVNDQSLDEHLNNYENPTAIQSVTWGATMAGHDLVGISRTGSGKTLAFLVPALNHIRNKADPNSSDPAALVLSPTRELAEQTDKYARSLGLRSVAVVGGRPRDDQIWKLRDGVDIVSACPGRLLDLSQSGEVDLENCGLFILDEADRMLDMGFEGDVRHIHSKVQGSQVLMFSATWPDSIKRLAYDFMKDPILISVDDSHILKANSKITQNIHVVNDQREKLGHLSKLLSDIYRADRDAKTLIFANTKNTCDRLCDSLNRNGIDANVLHGGITASARQARMKGFRDGTYKTIVATDVAARGLDVSGIKNVVNFDFPNQSIEDYVHRIGRTARGEDTGYAHTYIGRQDSKFTNDLIKLLERSGQEVPSELRRMY